MREKGGCVIEVWNNGVWKYLRLTGAESGLGASTDYWVAEHSLESNCENQMTERGQGHSHPPLASSSCFAELAHFQRSAFYEWSD